MWSSVCWFARRGTTVSASRLRSGGRIRGYSLGPRYYSSSSASSVYWFAPPRAAFSAARISAAGETVAVRFAMAAPVRPVAPSRASQGSALLLLARGLTLRSSRAPTARRAGQQALGLRPILRLLSSTPRCRARLNSNVRPHKRTLWALQRLKTRQSLSCRILRIGPPSSQQKRRCFGTFSSRGSSLKLNTLAAQQLPDSMPSPSLTSWRQSKIWSLQGRPFEAAKTVGYCYYPYKPDQMHWFCKPTPAVRTHHLHLIPWKSQLWQERLAFRDALRMSPTLTEQYCNLKLSLAAQHGGDREAYTEAKAPFVASVLRSHLAKVPGAA